MTGTDPMRGQKAGNQDHLDWDGEGDSGKPITPGGCLITLAALAGVAAWACAQCARNSGVT